MVVWVYDSEYSGATSDNEQKSFEYLRYELPTRLANMLKVALFNLVSSLKIILGNEPPT